MNLDTNHRFDVDPFSLERMACGVNALIEVLELPYPKLTVCSAFDAASTVMKILDQEMYVPMDLKQLSFLIQIAIDERGNKKNDAEKVMQVCARNYQHFTLTKILL